MSGNYGQTSSDVVDGMADLHRAESHIKRFGTLMTRKETDFYGSRTKWTKKSVEIRRNPWYLCASFLYCISRDQASIYDAAGIPNYSSEFPGEKKRSPGRIEALRSELTAMEIHTQVMPNDIAAMEIDTSAMPADSTVMPSGTAEMRIDSIEMPNDTTEMRGDITTMECDMLAMRVDKAEMVNCTPEMPGDKLTMRSDIPGMSNSLTQCQITTIQWAVTV